jgi:hypothetical protein
MVYLFQTFVQITRFIVISTHLTTIFPRRFRVALRVPLILVAKIQTLLPLLISVQQKNIRLLLSYKKLTGSQLVKKFPAFYGTRRFISTIRSTRHLSISWARSIQSMSPIPLTEYLSWYYPPIYDWVFQLGSFPAKNMFAPLLYPYVLYVPPISFFSIWTPE